MNRYRIFVNKYYFYCVLIVLWCKIFVVIIINKYKVLNCIIFWGKVIIKFVIGIMNEDGDLNIILIKIFIVKGYGEYLIKYCILYFLLLNIFEGLMDWKNSVGFC